MSKDIDNITVNIPSSKFKPVERVDDSVDMKSIMDNSHKFWLQEGSILHKHYNTGNTFANNSNKKNHIDIIRDLMCLLHQELKKTVDSPDVLQLIFNNITTNLNLIQHTVPEYEKDNILAVLHGYINGCLKTYEPTK